MACFVLGCAEKSPVVTPVVPQFEVRVMPSILLEGGDAWLTCYVPESYGAGRLRLAIEGVVASERTLEGVQTRILVSRPPCGQLLATCTILTARGQERRETTLDVRGGLCDNGTSVAGVTP